MSVFSDEIVSLNYMDNEEDKKKAIILFVSLLIYILRPYLSTLGAETIALNKKVTCGDAGVVMYVVLGFEPLNSSHLYVEIMLHLGELFILYQN